MPLKFPCTLFRINSSISQHLDAWMKFQENLLSLVTEKEKKITEPERNGILDRHIYSYRR